MIAGVDHFLQECPVCGRPLQISSDLAGRRVTCLHCRGRFLASSSVAHSLSPTSGASFLLRRAEELIEIASHRVELCACPYMPRPIVPGSRLQGVCALKNDNAATPWRDLRDPGRFGP